MGKMKLTAAPIEYKLYSLLSVDDRKKNPDRGRLPVDIDFKTGLAADLHKEVIMSKGAPVSKIYYTEAAINEDGSISYDNPIVRIDYTFDRDDISLARSCTQKFRWYDTNGNTSVEYKEVNEFYNTVEKMAEAEQRRSNIIDDLKVKAIGLLMYTEHISQPAAADMGKTFLAAYKAEIYNYIDEANTAFSDAVADAPAETYPWLDNMTPYGITIRQFILNGLT